MSFILREGKEAEVLVVYERVLAEIEGNTDLTVKPLMP